jgi:hypothetical protein
VVYRSSDGTVSVSGIVIGSVPTAREQRVFEVARIGRLVVTSIAFGPDPVFDRHDPQYSEGIICSI